MDGAVGREVAGLPPYSGIVRISSRLMGLSVTRVRRFG